MVLKKNRSCLQRDGPSQSHRPGFSTVLKYLEKELLKASTLQILKAAFSLGTVRRNHHLSPFGMFLPKYIGLLHKSVPFAHFSDPCMGKQRFKCFLSASAMSSLFTWLKQRTAAQKLLFPRRKDKSKCF